MISVTSGVFIFILVTTPYIHKIDNIRLILHRFLVVLICGISIAFKLMNDENAEADSFVYWIPLITLIILTLGIIINGACIIRLSIMWFKKKGVIDHSMKMKTVTTSTKP